MVRLVFSLLVTLAAARSVLAAIETYDTKFIVDTPTVLSGVTNIYTVVGDSGSINADLTIKDKTYLRLSGVNTSAKRGNFYVGTNAAGATVTIEGGSGFFSTYRNSTSPAAWVATGIDPGGTSILASYTDMHIGLPNGAPDSTGPTKFVLKDKSYGAFGGNQFGNIWFYRLLVESSVKANAEGYVDILEINSSAYADIGSFFTKNANPVRILFKGTGARIFRNNATSNGSLFNGDAGSKFVLEGVDGGQVVLHKQYHQANLTSGTGVAVEFKGTDILFSNTGEKGTGHPNGANLLPWVLRSVDNIAWSHKGNLCLENNCWLQPQNHDLMPYGDATGDIIISNDQNAGHKPGNANNYVSICFLDLYGTTQHVNSVISRYNTLPYPENPTLYSRGYMGVVTNTSTKTGVLVMGTNNKACTLNAACFTGVEVVKEGHNDLTSLNSCAEKLVVEGGKVIFNHTLDVLCNEFGSIYAKDDANLVGTVIITNTLDLTELALDNPIFMALEISLVNEAKISLRPNQTLKVRKVSVNGVVQNRGTIDNVSWLEAGAIDIIADNTATQNAVWTAGAGADTSVSTQANWSGDLPDFSSLNVTPIFSAGTMATFNGQNFLAGLKMDAAGDFKIAASTPNTLLNLYGPLQVGSDETVAHNYEIEPKVEFASGGENLVVPQNTTLRLSRGIDSAGIVDITLLGVKKSELINDWVGGRLELVDSRYNGSFMHRNGCDLYIKGDFGVPNDAGLLTLYNGAYKNGSNKNEGWAELGNIYLDGATVYKRVLIGSYGQVGGASNTLDWFMTAPNTTNIFKEVVEQSASIRICAGNNSVLIFEKAYRDQKVSGSGSFGPGSDVNTPNSESTYIFKGPVQIHHLDKDFSGNGTKVTHVWEGTGGFLVTYAMGNTVAEFKTDYVYDVLYTLLFNAGTSNAEHTRFELNGTKQRLSRVATSGAGRGCISGVYPSELEITDGAANETIARNTITNINVDIVGCVGIKMSGEGCLLMKSRDYSSSGDVSVTSGTLAFEQGATWRNGTNVTVSGTGVLRLDSADVFNRRHTVLRLSDEGNLVVPNGTTLKVSKLYIDGEEIESGIYTGMSHITGANLIQVGRRGTLLIMR